MEKMFKWRLDQLSARTAAQFSENNEFHDATMLSNKTKHMKERSLKGLLIRVLHQRFNVWNVFYLTIWIDNIYRCFVYIFNCILLLSRT